MSDTIPPSMTAYSPAQMQERRKLLATIHIAKKELGMDEDAYRDFVRRCTRFDSAGECSNYELRYLLACFRQDAGWKPKAKKGKSPMSVHKPGGAKTEVDKIRALWIDLHRRGIVRNGSEFALNRYVKRMTGVDHVDWLDTAPPWHGQCRTVIEALKKWGARYPRPAETVPDGPGPEPDW